MHRMSSREKYNNEQGRVRRPRCTFPEKFQKHRLTEGSRGLGKGGDIAKCFRCRILATLIEPVVLLRSVVG